MEWSQMFSSRVVVFGCGNTLFGDDGLGPKVIEVLQKEGSLGDDVALIDAGTSIRPLLFDLILSDRQPEQIIVVDISTDQDIEPGEVKEINVDQVDPKKIADFSMHQFPTTNLLKELQDTTSIKLHILVSRPVNVPELMEEGLSPEVSKAVDRIVSKIKEICRT
ncbi:hydrogenase maturation protease [Desulfonatronovibrio hydrogenovorans]|uniref:hydrogenase maturation protease n=1 Tax=Desulfonatronovibrio hydrogenovorans TaxID=53245 RepID=UPI00048E6207|nr:hydrogenase maturation protease [Desulfonatronovibrio hydrogenovorans]